MADKVTETLAAALRQALAVPGEQRLFKSGKLDGLFNGRGGVNAEAAALALRERLFEIVRTESKGKTTIEWVRPTPRGVEFVHEHESPLHALRELRDCLQATQAGVPVWLADMRRQLEALGAHLAEDAERMLGLLETLGQRVEQALGRLEKREEPVPDAVASLVPWGADALGYLDRRRAGGGPDDCPLPELFSSLTENHFDLSIMAFHEGLRQLQEVKALRLAPFTGPASELPQPEYALLDEGTLYYHVRR